MLGLVSTLCSFPLTVTAYDGSSRETRTNTTLAQERQDLVRQEAQLAQDSVALEERRAALAKRRADLIEREQQLPQDTFSTQGGRSEADRDVERTLTNMGAHESDRGFVLTLSDIQFQRDESELSADTMRKLYPLITLLKDESQRNIIIEGYTDSIGAEDYNRELSERRATAVRDFLVSTGIDPRRTSVRGYGEEHPIFSNDSENGRRENRRVEVIVTRDTDPRTAER
jgi:outer membrane protein OmpA-like peptidoglycan-associated protein